MPICVQQSSRGTTQPVRTSRMQHQPTMLVIAKKSNSHSTTSATATYAYALRFGEADEEEEWHRSNAGETKQSLLDPSLSLTFIQNAQQFCKRVQSSGPTTCAQVDTEPHWLPHLVTQVQTLRPTRAARRDTLTTPETLGASPPAGSIWHCPGVSLLTAGVKCPS